MTSDTPGDQATRLRDYVEDFQVEDEALAAARTCGVALGCAPIHPAGGAALRVLATALRARTVVEVGTGCGVSGLYLLRGMVADGVLTSIDVQPRYQEAARRAFTSAGVPAGRTRLIMGRGIDVLPRLADTAYDLLFVDTACADYPAYHEQGVRLLKPGGVIVFDNMLRDDGAAGPDVLGRDTVTLRALARAVREDERLAAVLLPVGEGLLAAARRPN